MVVGFAAIAMAGVINSPARRPLRRLVVALSLAGFLGYSLQPSTFARDEVWKFGVGLAVTFLVVGLMSNFRPRSFAVALLALGVAHFLLAYRSLALICAAAAFAVFLMVRHREIDRRADQAAKRSSWRLAALATFTVVSAVSIVSQYDQLATSGYLGDKQQQKAMALTSDTGSSLLTGRVEWLVSVYSIGESPVLGNGTGLPPPRDAVVSAYHQYQEWGLTTVATAIISDPPAYHSQILGSLAENGVAAIPFWVLFGWLAWRAFSTGLIDRLSASELNVAIFLMTLTAWNSLFSPFGSGHRLLLAIIFGVFIALENQRERGCRAAS
ncbi:hypothetical protein ABKW28_11070 [Nocardioides sp. 31GB23]|uniref:hypothetical protein n=1 Tax=Nocardioides sp. 31GB23 TaxID=3156065 RepID=UPI0032AFE8C8